MRRLLAITLLIAFFAPAAAPSLAALTADPEAGLPPCCRSHGAHHCAMLHWALQRADSGAPRFSSAACAQYPVAATVPEVKAFPLTAPPQFLVQPLQAAVLTVPAARRAQFLLDRTRQDRGPPPNLP